MKKSFLPAILLIIFILGGVSRGQNTPLPEPYQEKLLNGLKVLVWNDPKADKVTLKLRIHSGSVFDPKDKMGVMALLSDILFPDPQTFNYFTEDLEGKLEVASNYDYIQITATGKADEFISILDTIRVGVVTTPITQENFVKVRDARLAKSKEEASKIAMIADQTAAKRLLGDFPYGRSMNGTPESIAKIDRFDLVTAKEKFLDADNATLAITGRVDPRFAVRAAKQMLGNWLKSDVIVPATFAQPGDPDTRLLVVDQAGATEAEVRFVVRGLAANDKDAIGLLFWTLAFEKMFNAALPPECAGRVKINYEPHLLPAIWQIGGVFPADSAAKCYHAFKAVIAKADTEKVKPEVFSDTQKTIYQMISKETRLDGISEFWLNADTYKWGKVSDQLKLIYAVTPADGDKAAARLFWKAPVVSVIVGDAAKIKSQFDQGTVFALTGEQESRIQKEIADFLTSWRESFEKRDIDGLMKHYVPKLETFYRENGKDQNDIRAERAKGFELYDSMKLNLSKIAIQAESETVAHIIFDKKWDFRSRERNSAGAAQQSMKLVKTDGLWHITVEKDLQIYYMNNRQDTPPVKP